MKKRLFTPIVPRNNLEQDFVTLMERPGSEPGRAMMEKIFETYHDIDGHFIREFQTGGFDARVWELFLYAYFTSAGFTLNRGFSSPDFVMSRMGIDLRVEAVTANPSQLGSDASLTATSEFERIAYQQKELVPIRLGSALFSKLQKVNKNGEHYWEMEHTKNKPFVLAVENFALEESLGFSESSLLAYLYGVEPQAERKSDGTIDYTYLELESHRHGNKIIPSGFFNQPNTEFVSAVLFSNSGTAAKFNRMGQQGPYKSAKIKMIRVGFAHNPEPEALVPLPFTYEVGSKDGPQETWGQGITIVHNPNAIHRIPPSFFPNAAEYFFSEGEIAGNIPDFHPFNSFTYVFVFED